MTNITRYPLIDDFETQLAQAYDGSNATIYLNEVPSFTFPASTKTCLVINPWNSKMQLIEISAIDTNAKTATVSDSTLDKWASVAYAQSSHPQGSVVRISHNYQFWKDIVDAVNSKLDSNGGNTTTTFDLDVSGSNFRIRLDAGDMKFTDDNNSEVTLTTLTSWAGVNDKVKVSANDTTEAFLWTKLTGGDGITLTETNDWGNETLDIDIDLTDTTKFATDGTTSRAVVTTASGLFQATTSLRGWVEMATDAEVTTGTDETRYTNPKQLRVNSRTVSGNIERTGTEWSGNEVIAHWLGVTPRLVEFHFVKQAADGSTDGVGYGTYDWTTNQCIWLIDNGASAQRDLNASNCIVYEDSSGTGWRATCTMDATNITVAFTEWGTASDILVLWVAHA